jgi:hypothetical protein
MIKKLFFVFTFFTTISCNKKLTLFQQGKKESFGQNQSTIILEKLIIDNESLGHDLGVINEEDIRTETMNDFTSDATEKISFVRSVPVYLNFKKIEKEPIKELNKYKIERESTEKNFKKKRKLYPLFNDNLKIGVVFLVIAAVLAILNLNQLMLIFALASLIFLYLGLKKYFRRKRIKSWFKK